MLDLVGGGHPEAHSLTVGRPHVLTGCWPNTSVSCPLHWANQNKVSDFFQNKGSDRQRVRIREEEREPKMEVSLFANLIW